MIKEIRDLNDLETIDLKRGKPLPEQFSIYWPIIRAALRLVLIVPFVGRKVKNTIRDILTWGELIDWSNFPKSK